MRYDQKLADRIREALIGQADVEEKTMFQGMCFMVNGKMCICVRDDEMMCRIGPEKYGAALEMSGCRPMIHGGRVMKGFVFVSSEGYKDKKDFDRWIVLSLEFNKVAKASKRRRK
jgi:TfoX/Sxy family transcriptional regulator of competence genes